MGFKILRTSWDEDNRLLADYSTYLIYQSHPDDWLNLDDIMVKGNFYYELYDHIELKKDETLGDFNHDYINYSGNDIQPLFELP